MMSVSATHQRNLYGVLIGADRPSTKGGTSQNQGQNDRILGKRGRIDSGRNDARWLGFSGNALVSINVVTLRRTRFITWMGDRVRAGKPSRYVVSQLGRLSLLPSVGWGNEYQLSG